MLGIAETLRSSGRLAWAGTWQKVGTAGGTAGKWQKITGTSQSKIGFAGSMGGGTVHSIVLRSDGLLFGSGGNNIGQLGDNTAITRSTYVQATGISNAIAIAAGKYFTLTLRSDGRGFACGHNASGQLGDNSTSNARTYIQMTTP
jgi:alpha-tubulin suppressor-like RCC1 family protein